LTREKNKNKNGNMTDITPSPSNIQDTRNPTFYDKNIYVNGHLMQVYNVFVSFDTNFILSPVQQVVLAFLLPQKWSSIVQDSGSQVVLKVEIPMPREGTGRSLNPIKRLNIENTSGSNRYTIIGATSGEMAEVGLRKLLRQIQKILTVDNLQSNRDKILNNLGFYRTNFQNINVSTLAIGPENFPENIQRKEQGQPLLTSKDINYYKIPIIKSIAAGYNPQTKGIRMSFNLLDKEGFNYSAEERGAPASRKVFYDRKDSSKKLGTVSVFSNGKVLIAGSPSVAAAAEAFAMAQPLIAKSVAEGSEIPFSAKLALIDSSPKRLSHDIWAKEKKAGPTPIEAQRKRKKSITMPKKKSELVLFEEDIGEAEDLSQPSSSDDDENEMDLSSEMAPEPVEKKKPQAKPKQVQKPKTFREEFKLVQEKPKSAQKAQKSLWIEQFQTTRPKFKFESQQSKPGLLTDVLFKKR
jgi:hypothetical protein